MQKHTETVDLDHITVPVRDLQAARKFYRAALGAIGMKINLEVPSAFGMGSRDQKIFWLARDRNASGHGHYALRVRDPHEVDAFFRAAIAAGGSSNGKPGLRPDYGPNYYAAFVKDPEGNNLEVVCYGRASTRPRVRRATMASRRTQAKPNGRRVTRRRARG